MKVSAVCFGEMREFLPPDAEGNRATLELDDAARVLDLVHLLGAPERLIYVLLVNGERGRLEDPLADGDEVTLMPPYSGGSEDVCLLYTSPSPRDGLLSRMPSSA